MHSIHSCHKVVYTHIFLFANEKERTAKIKTKNLTEKWTARALFGFQYYSLGWDEMKRNALTLTFHCANHNRPWGPCARSGTFESTHREFYWIRWPRFISLYLHFMLFGSLLSKMSAQVGPYRKEKLLQVINLFLRGKIREKEICWTVELNVFTFVRISSSSLCFPFPSTECKCVVVLALCCIANWLASLYFK